MAGLLLTILLDDLLPIFVVAAAGFALARRWHVDVRSLSRVTFNALGPCLIFDLLVSSPVGADEAGQIVLFTVVFVLGIGLLARLAAMPLRLRGGELAAFLIVVMFSNAGNYGMSVVLFAFGRDHLARAALYFVTSALLMFTVGVLIATSGREGPVRALRGLARVPAVWGVLAAALVLSSGVTVPVGLLRPVQLLGDAAIPCMLLVLGMQLERSAWPARPGVVAVAALLTLVVAPAAGFGLAWALGLEGMARQALVVQTGMPTAVITTILALEFEAAPAFVTAVVVATTVLSPATVTLVVALAKGLP